MYVYYNLVEIFPKYPHKLQIKLTQLNRTIHHNRQILYLAILSCNISVKINRLI